MYRYLENFFLHTASAVCGDECCDGSPSMYWLADLVERWLPPMRFDDDLNCEDTQTRVRFWLYLKLTHAGIWVSDKNPRKEMPQCACNECSDYSGE